MDKNEAYLKAKRYAQIVRNVLPIKQIILFGSYANGTPHSDSDIDIAVIVDKITGDFLELSLKLYRLRREIDARIEPLLLESNNDMSGFLDSIVKTGINLA